MKYWHFLAPLAVLFISSCSTNSIPEAEPKQHKTAPSSKSSTTHNNTQQDKTNIPVALPMNTKNVPQQSVVRETSTQITSHTSKINYSNQAGKIKQLPRQVLRSLRAQGISTSGLSVYVQAVNNPNPLLTFQENTARNPASVMKALTSYAALGILGANYRWPIEVYTTGTISANTLRGDLIIKGYGYPDFKPKDLQQILNAIRSKGIRNIEGNLVFDNSYFAVARQNAGAFDGQPYKLYNAVPDALLFNERVSCFIIQPKGKGKIDVSCPTPARNVKIINNIRANNRACTGSNASPRMKIIPQGRSVTVKFSGNYSSRCGQRKYFKVVSDPANMLFASIWQTWVGKMGGSIKGGFAQHSTPSHAKLLYTYHSKPLRDVLPTINKKSNNVMARQLLLSIAAKKLGAAGTTRKGAQVVNTWLKSRGLNFPELRVDNGSGLSRSARISARHMGQLLADAYQSPYRNDFIRSLAIMGVDGTLKRRMTGTALKGRGQFKTGSLKDVRGIAGYIRAKNGQTYIVSILHNDPKARSRGRAAHDEVIKWVFSH